MSYELFKKAAVLNSDFKSIPSKIKLLSAGIIINKNGYIECGNKTYIPNIVKLNDLPEKIRYLFLDKNIQTKQSNENVEVVKNENENFKKLNDILFDQLKNIVDPDPEEDIDIAQEIKKANTICNVADKLISIADLSLKAEMFYNKKRNEIL